MPKNGVNKSKSVGRIAFEPYTIKNGVKHVALLGVVLRLHRIDGSSSTQCPSNFFKRL